MISTLHLVAMASNPRKSDGLQPSLSTLLQALRFINNICKVKLDMKVSDLLSFL